jgi:hypothetical protein
MVGAQKDRRARGSIIVWVQMAPGTPVMVTQPALPVPHESLSAQRAYGPSGGCTLHWGHDCGVEHAQLPPVPSQQRMPNAAHVAEHDAVQLHGRPGLGVGVGGGTGDGVVALTSGYDAICGVHTRFASGQG